ncbi:putative glutamine ABC transporter permease protein GlnM [Roseibium alexandrii]|jgi:general L-amino acid transport system permease protein|uniref:Amine acid ABC transporter, permease protein, 3-TM region, His/Glu/Gln/Arg/opine family n=3 Tax=Roseibium alexandrii TaxID=388408 RepID=A0A5E8H348_ROSAD|nr:amino acid ABC transporter permease [Roseibium alexandrii]EEE46453.2 amine acid ABC transporter, permease protein, 3-TM region, His/Glu/Gln/Arg/opine family [Roseibium alexandrii DFL-11]CTQ63890.1 putative glutamine ABC transporter permease protein GlnM [Roseibium alexandrii]
MSVMEQDSAGAPARASLVNDPKVRGLFYQALLIAALIFFGYFIVTNTVANLERQNIASGWGFVENTAGFGIIQSLVPYAETSSYGQAIFVGFLNTLMVAVVGIFFATIIGFVVGIARLSNNWVINQIAYCYVELVRNVPLLLQIFFWYFAVLRAVPGKREKWSLFDTFHLNIAGLRMPKPIWEDGSGFIGIALIIGIVASVVVSRWARKRQDETGQQFPVFWTALGLIIGLPVITYFVTGMPMYLEHPNYVETGPILRRGFELGVGFNLIPEFLALTTALAIYTAAFIAEIVRAGIQAVSHGQTEASHALGLRNGPTLRLVVIPQAMRVIIPPLTSQYLNLTKNSSLAVAIAFPDLVSVGGTVLNQTGQAIEIIAIWMAVYLSLSLITSAFMNWYNQRMALVER